MSDIQAIIGDAFENRADITPRNVSPSVRDAVMEAISVALCRTYMEEFGRILKEFSRTVPPGTWILGGDWDQVPGAFNANGIVATPDQQQLIVAQSAAPDMPGAALPSSTATTKPCACRPRC